MRYSLCASSASMFMFQCEVSSSSLSQSKEVKLQETLEFTDMQPIHGLC
jgi:hypothetical protein